MEVLDGIETTVSNVMNPLQKLEHRLHYWVTFLIMPVFAFSNAGVSLVGESGGVAFGSLSLSVFLALLIGKLVGIFSFSFVAWKAKWVSFPAGMNTKALIGVSLLGGIGFTMSLFIGGLSFEDMVLVNQSKVGIIMASLVAGVLGYLFLASTLKKSSVKV